MEPGDLAELTRWLQKLGGAGIAILPLVLLVGIIQIKNQIGTVLGKLVGGASKSAGGFGEKIGGNINNRRDINAAEGRGVWGGFLGSSRRRKFRREAKAASLDAGAKHAREHYTNQYAQDNERYAKQLAGGLPILDQISQGKYGSPSEAALDRIFANTKFKIQQVELEEIKAAHATIDLQSERELLNTIRDSATSNTKRAAALERLVQIGGMKSVAEAVNTYGKGVDGRPDGNRETTESRALAAALQKDGPGFLKASDIDNIRRGKLGQTELDTEGNRIDIPDNFAQITSDNLAANVFSPAKMAAASKVELEYASDIAQGNDKAVANLKAAAEAAVKNSTINVNLKHNREYIENIMNTGKVKP